MEDQLIHLSTNEIVSKYQLWAHKVSYALGGKDNTEHEDLAQEALIGVWKSIKNHDPDKGKMASFLAEGGKLQLKEAQRRHKYTGSPSLRGSSMRAAPPLPVDTSAPEHDHQEYDFSTDSVEKLDAIESVRRFMESLPEDYRTYLFLRFWCDMPPKDIQYYVKGNVRHIWAKVRQLHAEEWGS